MTLRALTLSAIFAAVAFAQTTPIPVIQQNGAAKQLMVDGHPFLILGGELHNSSASSAAYMEPIWPRLAALHLNTVVGTVSWELTEPEEGKFDFSLVDAQLAGARAHNMRLVLLWFGSWKNTGSNYVPIWVKQDKKRFLWAAQKQNPEPGHRGLYALSAFCKACEQADAHAYAMLMRHLREADPQHTVLMMQVENEQGVLGDGREWSPGANAAWDQQVPAALMTYLQSHRANLRPELAATWAATGNKTSGTWAQVFGSDLNGEEIFSAWHFAQYTEAVIAAGKKELALPMYVNAWLVQNPTQQPGGYPSGGPVSRMLDVWRAGAPQSDFFAPDIYIDAPPVMASYAVDGNPLFFPESRDFPGNYLWAIGHYNAIGVSEFGIDDLVESDPLGKVYEALGGAMALITQAQSAGAIAAFEPRSSGAAQLKLGGFDIHATFAASKIAQAPATAKGGVTPDVVMTQDALTDGKTGYALLIQSQPNEFYIMGENLILEFDRPTGEDNDWVVYDTEEGTFDHGQWIPGRRLNGDESSGLRKLALPGQFTVRRIRLYKHPGPGSMG